MKFPAFPDNDLNRRMRLFFTDRDVGYMASLFEALLTAPLSDAVEPKFSPRSCRVYSNLAPRSKMLPTALRDSQFFRRVYAVVTRWRYFSSASTLCKLFPIVIESRQAKRVAV